MLLGFDLQYEWRYITREYPKLAESFSAWCDVLELVAQRYLEMLGGDVGMLAMEKRTPGLSRALEAMGVWGWTQYHSAWRAADAVKCLAVLSGLLANLPMAEVPWASRGVSIYCLLPRIERGRFSGRWHYPTVRISARNEEKLPEITPDELFTFCAKYAGLLGVGLNWKKEALSRGRVGKWWVSFASRESLERFVREFDRREVDGVRVRVDVDQIVEDEDVRENVARGERIEEGDDLDISSLDLFEESSNTKS